MSAYTPGPWKVANSADRSDAWRTERDRVLAALELAIAKAEG